MKKQEKRAILAKIAETMAIQTRQSRQNVPHSQTLIYGLHTALKLCGFNSVWFEIDAEAAAASVCPNATCVSGCRACREWAQEWTAAWLKKNS